MSYDTLSFFKSCPVRYNTVYAHLEKALPCKSTISNSITNVCDTHGVPDSVCTLRIVPFLYVTGTVLFHPQTKTRIVSLQ